MKTGRHIAYLILSLALLVGGCTSGRSGRMDRGGRGLVADLGPPPGLNESQLSPLTGEALTRANLDLDEVIESMPRPAYLDQARRVDSEIIIEDVEPPLAAQKVYVAARRAWLNGNSTDAKKQLEAARRLTPAEPTILRLLGEVYTRTGNRVKGAQYFRQAVEIDPDDPRSLFILGRFAIEKGDFDEAIVLFYEVLARDDSQTKTDPALLELTHHFMANALRSGGYAHAAIEQIQAYLALTDRPIQASRFARDQVLLRRQLGVTRQLLGDLYMQAGDPREALSAYDRAADSGVGDRARLDKRRIFASLKLGDQNRARRMVIEQVQHQKADAQSLAMVRYLVSAGVSALEMAGELQAVYYEQGRPAELAIATADVLTADKAKALLIEHLRLSPEDRQVFYRLLNDHLLTEDTTQASKKSLTEAVRLTGGLMAQVPDLADEYGSALVTSAADTSALQKIIDQPGGSGGSGLDPTMRDVLSGLCLAKLFRYSEAQARFEQAVARSPGLMVARVELAKALIVQSLYEQAEAALEPLSDSNDTSVILLRSRVLAETGKAAEAVELIDRVIQDGGGDTHLVISKANLEIRLGKVQDAEQTLQDALNASPDSEPLYEALLDLYDPPQTGASAITNQTAKWRVLVKRLLGTIPNSRTGRLVQAQLYDAGRNYNRAEQILLELLGENPNDGRALNQLLDTYHAAGRTGEAITLLEARLEADPHDLVLLRMALRFYRESGDQDRLMQTQERVLMLEPESQGRAMRLGFIYRKWGKPQKAVEVLEKALLGEDIKDPVTLVSLLSGALGDIGEPDKAEQRIVAAIKRFPDHEADLSYLLATTLIRLGERERGERVMQVALAKFQDHAPSNNGLGYAMLMRNENPQRALEMIQRAVDAEPGNEAYMDSLGWAYYKLARYEDAEVWLRKARETAVGRLRAGVSVAATLAIINDHLGDTLHRLGRRPEAMRLWAEAGRYIGAADADDLAEDPELASLSGRLSDKIKAIRGKQVVPVAEVANPIAPEEAPVPQEVDLDQPKPQPGAQRAEPKAQDAEAPNTPNPSAPDAESDAEVQADPQPQPAVVDP